MFELVLFTSLLSVLNRLMTNADYSSLNAYANSFGILLQILIVGMIIPRSFAGSISRREIVVLLSYPVKRWMLLLSKVIANFLAFSCVFAFALLLNIPLLALSPLEPALYIVIGVMFVQTLFLCAVAIFMSLALKSEIVSVISYVLLVFGAEFSLKTLENPYPYLTLIGGNNVMFTYLANFFHAGANTQFTSQVFALAFAFPVLVSIILLVASFVYFQWVMQID